MILVWLIPATFVYILLLRVGATFVAHRRIRKHVLGLGGKVHDISWAPFRPGWSAERDDRVYSVTFESRDGAISTVHCTTGLLDGVVLVDDRDEPLAMDLQSAGLILMEKRRRAQLQVKPPEPH